MLKYATILNIDKGLCEVGLGTNEEYYQSIGMKQYDVEQSDIDGCWYLVDKCPHKTDAQKLQEAKDEKYQEALLGAKDFVENEAVYHFNIDNSIEATDGNIGKMNAYLTGFQAGAFETVVWISKEDNELILDVEDVTRILLGLGQVQSDIWSNQFLAYKNAIEQATTINQVNNIEIEYHDTINI